MVCFVVHIVLPLQPRNSNNAALERRVEHIARHANATLCSKVNLDHMLYYQYRVCENDTITLLRDFPTPFSVLQIDYLQSGENLFTYRKHKSPPHVPLLKQLYWLAKSTECWNLPTLNALPQTK